MSAYMFCLANNISKSWSQSNTDPSTWCVILTCHDVQYMAWSGCSWSIGRTLVWGIWGVWSSRQWITVLAMKKNAPLRKLTRNTTLAATHCGSKMSKSIPRNANAFVSCSKWSNYYILGPERQRDILNKTSSHTFCNNADANELYHVQQCRCKCTTHITCTCWQNLDYFG